MTQNVEISKDKNIVEKSLTIVLGISFVDLLMCGLNICYDFLNAFIQLFKTDKKQVPKIQHLNFDILANRRMRY